MGGVLIHVYAISVWEIFLLTQTQIGDAQVELVGLGSLKTKTMGLG